MSNYQTKWEDFLLDFSVQQMDGFPTPLKHFLHHVEIQHVDLVKTNADWWDEEENEDTAVTFTCRYKEEPLIFFFTEHEQMRLYTYTSSYQSTKEELYEVIDSTLRVDYQRELANIIHSFYKKYVQLTFGTETVVEETNETPHVSDFFISGINKEVIARQKDLSPTTLNFLISHSTNAHIFKWTPSESLTTKDAQLNTWFTTSQAPDFSFYDTYENLYADYTFQANQPIQLIYYPHSKQQGYLYWYNNHLWYRIHSSEFMTFRNQFLYIGKYLFKIR